jgi:hypothetical protein
MKNLFNLPEYKTIVYLLNNETARYEKQPDLVPFTKLPFELKIEATIEPKIKNNGAKQIITGLFKDKKRLFFTGLIPAPNFQNWYYGNDYEFKKGIKKNSLVLFHFANNNRELQVFYFNNYYKDNPTDRINLVVKIIKFILSILSK